jgi:hypothetical protein
MQEGSSKCGGMVVIAKPRSKCDKDEQEEIEEEYDKADSVEAMEAKGYC